MARNVNECPLVGARALLGVVELGGGGARTGVPLGYEVEAVAACRSSHGEEVRQRFVKGLEEAEDS